MSMLSDLWKKCVVRYSMFSPLRVLSAEECNQFDYAVAFGVTATSGKTNLAFRTFENAGFPVGASADAEFFRNGKTKNYLKFRGFRLVSGIALVNEPNWGKFCETEEEINDLLQPNGRICLGRELKHNYDIGEGIRISPLAYEEMARESVGRCALSPRELAGIQFTL